MTTWYSNSDQGMVVYMDEAAANELFGLTVNKDDKIVWLMQDADTDQPLISTKRIEGAQEGKLSWHGQNEYFQVGLPWPTAHGRKKRAMVDAEAVEEGLMRVLVPPPAADPGALLAALNKLNALISDDSMTVSVKNNRVVINVQMTLGG